MELSDISNVARGEEEQHHYEVLPPEHRIPDKQLESGARIMHWLKQLWSHVLLCLNSFGLLAIILAISIPRGYRENGYWEFWNVWSACSLTCGRGIQSRSRTCQKQSEICIGDSMQIQSCNINSCPPLFSAFSVYFPVGDMNGKQIFNTSRFQHGGDFNMSTGIFTCSVSGIYLFSIQLARGGEGTKESWALWLTNTTIFRRLVQLKFEYIPVTQTELSATAVTRMIPGEIVYISHNADKWPGFPSRFTGILLHPG